MFVVLFAFKMSGKIDITTLPDTVDSIDQPLSLSPDPAPPAWFKPIKSKKKNNYVAVTITESGDVSEDLKNQTIWFFKQFEWYLLCEEGGGLAKEHYHLHGVVLSNYKKPSDFKKYCIKPMYERATGMNMPWSAVVVKQVVHLEGALSYCYKERKVLCTSGIMLDTIKEWKSAPGSKTKRKITIPRANQVHKHIISYCEQEGIIPKSYDCVENVMKEMIKEDIYILPSRSLKGQVGIVLSYFGENAYITDAWRWECQPRFNIG